MSAPGMTAADAFGAEPQSFHRAMDFDRFDHIRRTGRIVAAGIRKYGTDNPLVNFYRDNEKKTEKLSDKPHDQR